LTAYPGSPIYKNSAINWKAYRHDFAKHVYTGEKFDEKYILKQFDKIGSMFYFNPIYWVKLFLKHRLFAFRKFRVTLSNFLFRRLGL